MRLTKKLPSQSAGKVPWVKISYLLAGMLLTGWLLGTPDGLLGKADAVGYAVCHRIDARSFHLGTRQIPLCARCTGQYLGALVGMIYLMILGNRRIGRPPRSVILPLVAVAIFYAVDGLNSYLHLLPNMSRYYLYEPNNTLRLLTGTGLGLGVSVVLVPAFHQTVWTKIDRRPSLGGMRALAGMVAAALVVDFLVLTENPLILYPLALLSAAGVMLLLTIVYTMVWVMLTKEENQFLELRQLWPWISAGFTTALLQIAALDVVRYLLTGSWDGFHFG